MESKTNSQHSSSQSGDFMYACKSYHESVVFDRSFENHILFEENKGFGFLISLAVQKLIGTQQFRLKQSIFQSTGTKPHCDPCAILISSFCLVLGQLSRQVVQNSQNSRACDEFIWISDVFRRSVVQLDKGM
jgi:hypothetical protein